MPERHPRTVFIFDYLVVDAMLASHALTTLLRNLDECRYRPVVILNRACELQTALQTAGVVTYVLPHGGGHFITKLWQYGSFVYKAVRLARLSQPALFYANNALAGRDAMLTKVFFNVPVAVMLRNIGMFPRGRRFLFRANRFLVHTKHSTEGILPPRVADKSRAVSGCLDMSGFPKRSAAHRVCARRSLGVPDDALIVAMIGRLTPQKGQRFFIQAANKVCAGRRNALFMHAGKIPGHGSDKLTGSICDEYELELLQLSQDLVRQRRFLWFDYMDDVEKFWAAADVAVLASAGPEAFGLVILEAMACGLPVVATRSGGPAVVVTPDVGILVPMADADALAEAIEALLGDPARRAALGANGRRCVEDQYSPAAFAEVIMTEFDAQARAEGRV